VGEGEEVGGEGRGKSGGGKRGGKGVEVEKRWWRERKEGNKRER